jgi:hypothetical protein
MSSLTGELNFEAAEFLERFDVLDAFFLSPMAPSMSLLSLLSSLLGNLNSLPAVLERVAFLFLLLNPLPTLSL